VELLADHWPAAVGRNVLVARHGVAQMGVVGRRRHGAAQSLVHRAAFTHRILQRAERAAQVRRVHRVVPIDVQRCRLQAAVRQVARESEIGVGEAQVGTGEAALRLHVVQAGARLDLPQRGVQAVFGIDARIEPLGRHGVDGVDELPGLRPRPVGVEPGGTELPIFIKGSHRGANRIYISFFVWMTSAYGRTGGVRLDGFLNHSNDGSGDGPRRGFHSHVFAP